MFPVSAPRGGAREVPPTAVSVSRRLAVSAGRARVILRARAFLIRFGRAGAPANVLKAKNRDGATAAPTTRFGLLTALGVAARAWDLPLCPFAFRRAKRALKKELALFIRKQARPLKRKLLRKILRHPETQPIVRKSLALIWVLALRVGNLGKITNADVHFLKVDEVPFARVRLRGLKGWDLGMSNCIRFVPLVGLAAVHRHDVRCASSRPPTAPFLDVSPSAIVKRLKAFDPQHSGHSPRRGAATFLANRGLSKLKISEILMHKNVAMTRLYVDPAPRQREVHAQISASRLLLGTRPCRKPR